MKEIPLSENRSGMKILIDADVIVEGFLNRGGFVEYAESLFKAAENTEHIRLYVMEKCLKRICIELGYLDEQVGKKSAHSIEMLLQGRIVPHSDGFRELARQSTLRDFDSAEELACATIVGFDAIITLNPQNFEGASLPIWSVDNLLVRLKLERSLSILTIESGCEVSRKTVAVSASHLPKATTFKESTPSWTIPPGWHPNNYFKYLEFWDPQELWSN